MAKKTFRFVDLVVESEQPMNIGESRYGELTFNSDDQYLFTEHDAALFRFREVPTEEAEVETIVETTHVVHPELHWRLLDRTKHGKISINARHVKVEFYIRHADYTDGSDLADQLASEIETMGEHLCEMDLAEEVEGIHSLRMVNGK